VPKKILPISLILVMVLSTVGLASASVVNPINPVLLKPNDPASALFTKTESAKELQIGDLETFTITIKNPNSAPGKPLPANANDFASVKISDVVPAGLQVTSVSGGTFNGNTVSASIGTMKPGDTVTITIVAKALTAGKYINTATGSYIVNQGHFVLKCHQKENTHTTMPTADPKLHKGETIGCWTSIKQDDNTGVRLYNPIDPKLDPKNNHNPIDPKTDRNIDPTNDHNCKPMDNNYKWVLTCKIPVHTHDAKCYKWCDNLVPRTLSASSDPILVDAATPVTPVTPAAQEKVTSTVTEPNEPVETIPMAKTGAVPTAGLVSLLVIAGAFGAEAIRRRFM
jgi:fimbrial isopeptide formation D2 family protein